MKYLALKLEINGEVRECIVAATRRLLDVLRDDFGLTGTKECCGTGDCGACTVLLDGRPINSCVYLAAASYGRQVTTIEGLSDAPETQRLSEAFLDGGAVQCGFCTPGILVIATSLLRAGTQVSNETVRHYLAGNLCRCTGYMDIVDAVIAASEHFAPSSGARE